MIFQNINKIHLAPLDLNVPVCVLIPKVVVIADNSSRFGHVPKDFIHATDADADADVGL